MIKILLAVFLGVISGYLTYLSLSLIPTINKINKYKLLGSLIAINSSMLITSVVLRLLRTQISERAWLNSSAIVASGAIELAIMSYFLSHRLAGREPRSQDLS